MEKLIKKENDIFDILQKFIDKDLNCIIVGGYAVSAFKNRFSVDADIVVKSEDLSKFEERTFSKQVQVTKTYLEFKLKIIFRDYLTDDCLATVYVSNSLR
jgi:hypothetical protein